MPGPSKGLALSQPCLESLAQFLTKLRSPLLQPPSRGGADVEDTACYPACKVPVLQQAILPFLPSCREGIQHSGAAQPAGWAGGTFNQRGATLRAMEGPASILPALLLLTICPPGSSYTPSTAQLEAAFPPALPQFKQASGSSDPGGYPLSSSGCRPGHLPHGRPLPRGLVPRRCTRFPELASPETLLGFVPDWVVCNQINLLGGALHQALYLAGQDQKTLALLPTT